MAFNGDIVEQARKTALEAFVLSTSGLVKVTGSLEAVGPIDYASVDLLFDIGIVEGLKLTPQLSAEPSEPAESAMRSALLCFQAHLEARPGLWPHSALRWRRFVSATPDALLAALKTADHLLLPRWLADIVALELAKRPQTPATALYSGGIDANATLERYAEALMRPRIEAAGLNYAKLCASLQKHGAVIAGSFPLQALLGLTWPGSDIDIWMRDPLSEEDFEHHYGNAYYPGDPDQQGLPTCSSQIIEAFIEEQGVPAGREWQADNGVRYTPSEVFMDVHAYRLSTGMEVQFIRVRHDVAPMVALDDFDFDVCACAFDGKRLFAGAPNAVLNKVATTMREQQYIEGEYESRYVDRRHKYISRGFKVVCKGYAIQLFSTA